MKRMFNPSSEFVELVARVHNTFNGGTNLGSPIPKAPTKLWEAFLFPMFIGARRRAAQASYAVDVLRHFVSLPQARKAQDDAEWSVKLQSRLASALRNLGDTPPDGLKRSVLRDIEDEVTNGKLANMAAGMASFIDRLEPDRLKTIRGDLDLEFQFVEDAVGSHSMPGVGYTRFVIWMHSCNTGWTLTPPSGPVRWAVHSPDIGYKGSLVGRWGDDEAVSELGLEERQAFGALCTQYNALTREVQPMVDPSLKPVETQNAAWYLGATHASLGADAKAKAKFSAKKLVRYLDQRGWSVETYSSEISDIDRCLPLIEDLKTRL